VLESIVPVNPLSRQSSSSAGAVAGLVPGIGSGSAFINLFIVTKTIIPDQRPKTHFPLINLHDKYFPTIGILRPMPKAFGEIRNMGGV
jgi:hypothetical protein